MKKIILVLSAIILSASTTACSSYNYDIEEDLNYNIGGESTENNNGSGSDGNVENGGSDDGLEDDVVIPTDPFENFLLSLTDGYKVESESLDNTSVVSYRNNVIYDETNGVVQLKDDVRYNIFTLNNEIWTKTISLDEMYNNPFDINTLQFDDFDLLDGVYYLSNDVISCFENLTVTIENDEFIFEFDLVDGPDTTSYTNKYEAISEIFVPKNYELAIGDLSSYKDFYATYEEMDSFVCGSDLQHSGYHKNNQSSIYFFTDSSKNVYVNYLIQYTEDGYEILDVRNGYYFDVKIDGTELPAFVHCLLNFTVVYTLEGFMFELENSIYDEESNEFVYTCSEFTRIYSLIDSSGDYPNMTITHIENGITTEMTFSEQDSVHSGNF